tara:strand:+ start:1372 stop:1722 length:351 start_codon:yes stop_codon:yes gene_type:complete
MRGVTLIRIYPDKNNPGRSISKVSFYHTPAILEWMTTKETGGKTQEELWDEEKGLLAVPSIEANISAFCAAVEEEDYNMGEMQQIAAESGQLEEITFGRNEPALHHFHRSFKEAVA